MDGISAYLHSNLHLFKGGSLCIFGNWFGRPLDNFHQITGFSCISGILTLTFDEGETLTVWEPRDIAIEQNSFRIQYAHHVRWEWYYYGKPKIEANRYFEDFVHTKDGIKADSNVDWYSPTFTVSESKPAVLIV